MILASKSPRRKELLELLGVRFDVVTADTDESASEKDPKTLVELLAERKGQAVRELLAAQGRLSSDTVILSADTVVSVDGEILGKPRDADDAGRMLRLYSGRTHEVVSGICLLSATRSGVAHEVTEVEFEPLDEATIARYIRTERPFDKAGAYAIQGMASAYIKGIHGDYFNVVGLPIHRMNCLWREIFGENMF